MKRPCNLISSASHCLRYVSHIKEKADILRNDNIRNLLWSYGWSSYHFHIIFFQETEIFIPLNSFMVISVIYYIKSYVVAVFSGNPMHSVNPMSVKVMHDCIAMFYFASADFL